MHLRRVSTFYVLVTPLATSAWAGIVEDVRGRLADNNLSLPTSFSSPTKGKMGSMENIVEAYSWLARAAFE